MKIKQLFCDSLCLCLWRGVRRVMVDWTLIIGIIVGAFALGYCVFSLFVENGIFK